MTASSLPQAIREPTAFSVKTQAIVRTLLALLLASAQSALAGDKPATQAKILDPTGRLKITYTTDAYRREALRLLIEEANAVARDMNLPETLPITESDVVVGFICPFGFGYKDQSIGRITTKNYDYGVTVANRFSALGVANYDDVCRQCRASAMWPTNRVDTAGAYRMAVEFLAAAHMDVAALNRDCHVTSEVNSLWNGFREGQVLRSQTFVPIYDVFWQTVTNREDLSAYIPGQKALVEVFTPTQTLLQLSVTDPKYILRQPAVFKNLAELVGGTNIIALAYQPYTNKVRIDHLFDRPVNTNLPRATLPNR
jgi:hypothetical protein